MAATLHQRCSSILSSGADLSALAPMLDGAELESPNPQVLVDWPHVLHLLGHIYNKQLADARMLWKRIPPIVKEGNPELSAVWRLLQHLWQRQYIGVWQELQAHPWSPQAQPLVDALSAKTRQELIELIGMSYVNVKPSKVASLCGMPLPDALAACQQLGWQFDEAAGVLRVVSKPQVQAEHEGAGNLQSLAQIMAHIEH